VTILICAVSVASSPVMHLPRRRGTTSPGIHLAVHGHQQPQPCQSAHTAPDVESRLAAIAQANGPARVGADGEVCAGLGVRGRWRYSLLLVQGLGLPLMASTMRSPRRSQA
jgi:hypothetical protein